MKFLLLAALAYVLVKTWRSKAAPMPLPVLTAAKARVARRPGFPAN